ncbi:hypothetical protein CASFOL_042447 [Castilleja foliolosa]|uniref:Uncharacterized protein n=1 Tax=Castilleja foliolosa TaxID=1961234 RepID=A0ABD3BB02_9LAMI
MSLQEELLHIMPQEKDSLAVDVSNIWGDNINPDLITPEENECNKSPGAAENGKDLKKKPRITKRKKTPSPKKVPNKKHYKKNMEEKVEDQHVEDEKQDEGKGEDVAEAEKQDEPQEQHDDVEDQHFFENR